MNGFAIAGLVYLYGIVYGLGLWMVLKSRNEPATPITKGALIAALFMELLQILAILAIWFDHDPTNMPRIFVAFALIGEVVFESYRGYLHYKKSVPLKKNMVKTFVQSAIMIILIGLLAFVL